jgi:hypothetical protein
LTCELSPISALFGRVLATIDPAAEFLRLGAPIGIGANRETLLPAADPVIDEE